MSDSKGCKENICTYGMKFIVLLCGIIGIIFSIAAAESCDFITFVDTDGNPPDMAEDPPFNTALAGSVGIFGYTIIEGAYNATTDSYGATTDGNCVGYEYMFFGQSSYPSLATSQFCVLIAPILAGIGLFANLVDFCVCNFTGSNLIGSLFFIGASLVSAGTFLLLADPAFCLEDSELECTVGSGIYMSIGSTVFYFISCLLLFCSPQADPFCYNFGFKNKSKTTKYTTDEPEGRRSRMRTIDEGGETPQQQQQQQPTTVVVNIISNNDDEDGNKRRKKKNQTSRTPNDNDDDDDFDSTTMNSKKKKKKKKNQTSIASDAETARIDDDDSNSNCNSNSNHSKNQTSTTSDDYVDDNYDEDEDDNNRRKKKNNQTSRASYDDDFDTTTTNSKKKKKKKNQKSATTSEYADTTIN